MNRFFETLIAALKAKGFNNITYSTYNNYIMVAGCKYRLDVKRTRMTFDGAWSYPQYPRHAHNVSRAVQHVISTLPKKMEELVKEKDKDKRRTDGDTINRSLEGTNLSVYGSWHDEEFNLTMRHPDKSTIMAAADCLIDNGFTSDSTPQTDEENFTNRRMLAIWRSMNEEQQLTFITEEFLEDSSSNAQRQLLNILIGRH